MRSVYTVPHHFPDPAMNNVIERGAGVSLWRQIEEALADDIGAKRLTDRLPNELELAERFGVNRHTIRRAVQALESRGLVRIEQGRGTFVQEDLIDYRLGRRQRFSHSLENQRLSGQSRIVQTRVQVARDDICRMLALPAGSEVLQIDALDVVEDRIVGVCTEYLPMPRFAGFDALLKAHGTMSAALRAFGITEFSRKLSRVTARMPRAEVATQLAQPKTQPILYVESVYQDGNGQVIEYGVTRFAGDAVQLVFEPDQAA